MLVQANFRRNCTINFCSALKEQVFEIPYKNSLTISNFKLLSIRNYYFFIHFLASANKFIANFVGVGVLDDPYIYSILLL